MKRGERLPASDHVAGYCNLSSLDDEGRPTTDSFRIDEDGVSVDHLEWFDREDLSVAKAELQKFKKRQRYAEVNPFRTRRSGKFAIMVVEKIETTGAEVVADCIPDDPAHALIQGIPGQGNRDAELQFKATLAALVECVFPAWPSEA